MAERTVLNEIMKNFLHKFLLSLAAAVVTVTVKAAEPKVTSRLEPDSIFIGDRFELVIDVEKDLVQSVAFPEFTPDPKSGLELVESAVPDTLQRDGRKLKIRKRYVLAAFEEGLFDLGRAGVLYADKNIVDTIYGEGDNILKVATFIIDSTSHAVFDIKPQKNLPFRFGEISGWLLLAVVVLAVVAVIAHLLKKWLEKRGKSLKSIFAAAPPQPPHIVAIKALEELRNRKLWQNNKHKAYYSGLSDILRTYLSGRYGIGAMEMTTDEITEAVQGVAEMPAKCIADLTTVLRDADLAKFAKFEPDAEQNEGDWNKAYYFVEETKEAEPENEDDDDKTAGNKFLTICLLLAAFTFGLTDNGYAQRMPERGLVRKGNRQYARGNFERSIERYTQALQKDSLSFEATYNLGNALYRAERFEGAEQTLARAAADTTRTVEERAEAFFNLGDVQFRQQNLQGALESFKNSLRLNPSDMEAKYNYAYVKKLLEQQQNDDQNQNGGNDNQNNDQNQQNQQNNNQNNDQNDNNNNIGDNQDQNDRNQDSDSDDKQQGEGEQRPQQGQISPEQLEAMLDAIQAQEDKTQDKVKEKQGVIIRGKKNW